MSKSNISISFKDEYKTLHFQNVETNIHDGVLTLWIYDDPTLGDFMRHFPLHSIDYIDEKRVPCELKVDRDELNELVKREIHKQKGGDWPWRER